MTAIMEIRGHGPLLHAYGLMDLEGRFSVSKADVQFTPLLLDL